METEAIQGITLKSLLQDPFALLPKVDEKKQDKPSNGGDDIKDSDKQKEKEKELELDYDPFATVNPMSAFLGPKLWDDTMLYDGKDLKFEFMDIDEFLTESGILDNNSTTTNTEKDKTINDAIADGGKADEPAVLVETISPQEVISMSLETLEKISGTATVTDNLPIPPREPSPVNVNVDFALSHTVVALATIPGEDTYDPITKQFTDEELKPQPMIKKSKKVFVPEEQKDGKYWERRRKNNVAAKRSRDARRIKENQIVLRAAYLEKLNGALKGEVVDLKKENMSLKSVVQRLERELKEAIEKQPLL
ncbi:thyrotroph embryonic factor-like [Amphiura filiformis]|uniref:thyrotroph embryonic factor-like n=1 Tax=Amphiura filiformis TaxID=82378 RepID=UPI003B20F780